MAGPFDDLLSEGGGIARQLFLWGMLEQLVEALAEPVVRQITETANAKDPNDVLSPADLAQLVVRHVMEQKAAAEEAAKSGVNPDRFAAMLDIAAEPPGLETVLQMYRRGIVPWGKAEPGEASVANAIATSRIYTYWSDAIRRMNVVPIPPAEMVDALVEGQTTRGDRGAVEAAAAGGESTGFAPDATTFYEAMWASGYTPDQADLMFRTRGNPPSPSELFELFRRGLIPKTGAGPEKLTVEQGIHEGATKDKWWPTMAGLIREIPSEYYLKLMMKTGTITRTLGAKLLAELGYTQEVITGLVSSAEGTAVIKQKQLTESIIEKLYEDRILARDTALKMLGALGYSDANATFILETVDMAKQSSAVDTAVTRVGTLFRTRKIDRTQAQAALHALGVTGTGAASLLQTWTLERGVTVKILTESQIADAWDYGIIDQATALATLQAIGYTPIDAWLVLSVKNKGPLPGKPTLGVGLLGTH